MKTLKESLFDDDLVEKEVPGHCLKDLVFFDGQLVYRIFKGSKRLIYTGDYVRNNALYIFDWNKVKKDLKKFGGDKIDLRLYAYASSNEYVMRTTETNKKSEDFARLILSIPFIEEYQFGGFNSRFRYEFIPKLEDYMLPQYKNPKSSYISRFYFDFITQSKYSLRVVVRYGNNSSDDPEVLSWEFLKLPDR